MNKRLSALLAVILSFVLLSAALAGCASSEGFAADGTPQPAQPDYVRTPPPVALAQYVGENEQRREEQREQGLYSALIDLSNLSKGYVTAQLTAPVKARMRVIKGEVDSPEADTYLLDNTGAFNFFPLTRGNGRYTFVINVFIEDTLQGARYERFIVAEADVTLESEFAPFLVPSVEVNYTDTSACVALSYDITQNCSTNLEVVQQVYAWITDNISYDVAKAEAVNKGSDGYLPNPDDTLRTRNGICYDYAALAAAMLRANAIPTKLIKGDVATGDGGTVYHAWNMVWLAESGWIAVGLSVNQNDWTRMDATFGASSAAGIASFIGDGSNYVEFSQH